MLGDNQFIYSNKLGGYCDVRPAHHQARGTEIIPNGTLAAFVYEENVSSVRCFEKNGFVKEEEIVEDGRRSFLLKLN